MYIVIKFSEYLMFFLIFSLTIGLLLLLVKHKTSIPYTPLLLLFGMIIGYFSESLWRFGDSLEHVSSLSGHTLLLVFIPPLIFESSYNIDVFTFT